MDVVLRVDRSLPGGDVRVVLNSGGHIAGIVNPANPKLRVLSSDANPPCAQARRRKAARRVLVEASGALEADRAGPLAAPTRVGSRRHRVRADGPADYVHG